MNLLGWFGLAFELLGALVVGVGVYDTFRAFKARGGEWHFEDRLFRISNWLCARFIRRPPKITRGSVAVGLNRSSSLAGGFAPIILPNLQADPEALVAELQRVLRKLQGDITGMQVAIERDERARMYAIEKVNKRIKFGEQETSDRMEEIEVGGLRLESVGLAFVVLGTVLSAVGSALS